MVLYSFVFSYVLLTDLCLVDFCCAFHGNFVKQVEQSASEVNC